jgi:hypothetical protein
MKHDLIKFLHWLSISTFKSKWFEENIKLQIISLLSWIIYKDYRNQTPIFKLISHNRFILTILLIISLWSTTLFTFGRLSNGTDIKIIKRKVVINDHLKEIDFENLKSERRFIEYMVFSRYKIDHYHNLQKLPDDVFFTIISEIQNHRIPPSLFFRLLDQESGFTYIRNNKSGAYGYGQNLPSTCKQILNTIGSTGHDKIDNIRVSAFHLARSYKDYTSKGFNPKESWYHSLLDYNGGSETLARDNMRYFTYSLR